MRIRVVVNSAEPTRYVRFDATDQFGACLRREVHRWDLEYSSAL